MSIKTQDVFQHAKGSGFKIEADSDGKNEMSARTTKKAKKSSPTKSRKNVNADSA